GDDDAARADACTLADVDCAEDAGVAADDDVGPQVRVADLALERGASEHDALVEDAALFDDRGLTDDDAHAVVDEDSVGDPGAGVNLDAGEEARLVRDHAGRQL